MFIFTIHATYPHLFRLNINNFNSQISKDLVMRHILLFILLLPFVYLKAQQHSGFRIGVEYGSYELAGEIHDRWEFRQEKLSYSYQDNYHEREYVEGEGSVNFVGLKSELSVWKNRLTLASGLRYTHVCEMIFPTSRASFYLYHPSSRGIELFRIREMNESIGYIGIPVEADIVLLGLLSNWQLYIKAGMQAGVRIHDETRIDFTSKEMEKYRDEIITTAGETPSNFFMNAYSSLGLRLILKNGIRFSIEAIFPPNFITKDNFTLFLIRHM